MLTKFVKSACLAAMLACVTAGPAFASQSPIDRADPALVQQDLRDREPAPSAPRKGVRIDAAEAPESAVADQVTIGAIRIHGAEAIPASAFAPIMAAYAGRTLSPRELRRLVSDIANFARRSGYGLATAWIPKQHIANGILRVTLDEGRIDAVEVEGTAAASVRRMLASLTDGRPVRTADLERRLLLAGDIPGIWVGKARLDRRAGRNVLIVATSRDKVEARAAIDNWGSSAVGPVRAQALVNLNGVAADDDRVMLGGVLTPFDPNEFAMVRAGYGKGIGREGTVLSVDGYYAWSSPGAILSGRDVDGRSLEATLGLNHPFLRVRAASLWGDLTFSVRDSVSSREDVRIREDRLATVTATGFASLKLGESRLRGRVALVQGLGLLDATREGDPLASRSDGSAVFSKVEAWGRLTTPVTGALSLQLEAEGQLASRPLLSSEEIGLGGRNFLRGYDYRELSGDKGVAASAELRFDLAQLPRPVQSAQLYVYADAGSVGNYEDGIGGGTLASAGGGVRLGLGKKVEASLELGFPLKRGFDPDQGRDPRVSFTVGVRF